MRHFRKLLRPLFADRRGATAVEYALIIALVVLAMLGALKAAASTTVGIWNNVSNKVQEAK